jgi:Uma2 family endonuclease
MVCPLVVQTGKPEETGMKTILRLGPADHGRRITKEEFAASSYETGYQYEIIDGKLYVSPLPSPAQNFVERWLWKLLERYSDTHPEVINYVSTRAGVEIATREEPTVPEPDISAYHNYPSREQLPELSWEMVSPILVAEVMSPNNPTKDLVRNVELYLLVPSIREYWILDTRANPLQPTLLVHRRHGKRWRSTIEVSPGEIYTTRLLPGFSLLMDPQM